MILFSLGFLCGILLTVLSLLSQRFLEWCATRQTKKKREQGEVIPGVETWERRNVSMYAGKPSVPPQGVVLDRETEEDVAQRLLQDEEGDEYEL